METLAGLVSGCDYLIKIRDWISPFGDVVEGRIKTRTFLSHVQLPANGAASKEQISFIKVRNNERNSIHLIAAETIEYIAPVGKADCN